MLGDGTGFSRCAVAFSNGIDQAGFSMVDMPHKATTGGRVMSSSVLAAAISSAMDLSVIRMPFFFRSIDRYFTTEFLTQQLNGGFIFQKIVKRDDKPL